MSETNYYIELFNRWMAIHGKSIIWFGKPHDWERIPVKALNSGADRAEAAYEKVRAMLHHNKSYDALQRLCYPEYERPWIRSKRVSISIFDHACPTVKPQMAAIMRAITTAGKIEKMISHRMSGPVTQETA